MPGSAPRRRGATSEAARSSWRTRQHRGGGAPRGIGRFSVHGSPFTTVATGGPRRFLDASPRKRSHFSSKAPFALACPHGSRGAQFLVERSGAPRGLDVEAQFAAIFASVPFAIRISGSRATLMAGRAASVRRTNSFEVTSARPPTRRPRRPGARGRSARIPARKAPPPARRSSLAGPPQALRPRCARARGGRGRGGLSRSPQRVARGESRRSPRGTDARGRARFPACPEMRMACRRRPGAGGASPPADARPPRRARLARAPRGPRSPETSRPAMTPSSTACNGHRVGLVKAAASKRDR